MPGVLTAEIEQHPHMRIGETVIHHPPVPSVFDNPGSAQQAQGLGYRRLRDLHRGREVAHAQLTGLAQRVENPHPPRVTEQPEHRGELHCLGVLGNILPCQREPSRLLCRLHTGCVSGWGAVI